jgi:hypothetical protein
MSRVARLLVVVAGIVVLLLAAAAGFILRGVWDKPADEDKSTNVSPAKSTATVRVSAREPAIYPSGDNKFDPAEWDHVKRTMMAMAKAGPVVGKALDDKAVQELAIVKQHGAKQEDWLADQITVEFPGNGELMTISVTAGDHDQSKTIVDAVVSAFQREVIDRERTERLTRCDLLERKLNSLKSQVLDKERQLYNLSQQTGTADGQTAKVQYKMQVDALDTLMRSRTDIQRQISDLDLKLALAKFLKDASDRNSVPEDEIESVVFKDPQMQQAMNELAGLQREQAEIEKAVKKPTDPAATRIRDQIRALKKSIDEMKIAATLQVKEQLKRNGDGSSAGMQQSLVERQLLAAQYKQITEQITMQAKAIQNLEKFDGEAEQLREEIDQLHGIVKEMGSALTKMKIELDAEPRVSIVEQGN